MRDSIDLNQVAELYFRSKVGRLSPARSNQASGLAWPVRHLILKRIAWKYGRPFDVSAHRRFERGREIGRWATTKFLPSIPGVELRATEIPVENRQFEIAGRIDAEIFVGGMIQPVEIKSVNYINRYHSTKQFLNDSSIFMKNYYHQINMYLFMSSLDIGQILLIDPGSFETRFLEHQIDYEAADEITKKCKEVNHFVHRWDGLDFLPEEVEELPECDECFDYCQFHDICGRTDDGIMTDQTGLDLDRIEWLCERITEINPMINELNEVKVELRNLVQGNSKVVTKNWIIIGGIQQYTNYQVPREIKEQYRKTNEYWKIKKIIRRST